MTRRYDFRDVTERDLPLLKRWMAQPHWREWWDEPDAAIAEIRQAMDSIETEPLIVELGGKPIAYTQIYDPHLEDGHPYQDQPFGTLGVDLAIGPSELLGQGHGSALLRQLCETLFEEGCPRVIIDPHPDNARAVNSYKKAGFKPFDTRVSVYGPALLMALEPDDSIDG